MVICTTTGYFISVIGPYFADSKNNDASILNHIIKSNVQSIREWVHESDVFIVDRGFRDSLDMLEDLGIKAKMPCFMRKGDKQMPVQDANASRLVTKVRWVVESANARIKRWRYLASTLPTNQVRNIGQYVRIVCALSNRYLPPLSPGKEDDVILAAKMKHLSTQDNLLQRHIEDKSLHRLSAKWQEADTLEDFPRLNEVDLRNLTCGTYQLKLCSSYMQEHIEGDASIHISKEDHGFIRVKLQSRHVTSKQYIVWVKYGKGEVMSSYCKCRAGARTVGMCSHRAAVIWYLGYARHLDNYNYGVTDWGEDLQDAATSIIDESDTDESVVEE
ncbi:hypothetical protein FSP39_011968 [Pinctada imbricata]|uniref:SWIM-type domain-containing protein n=1 Tax=Pinctada imbricata TaxID=66713 RepID=A0AA89CAK4_PINIB|nr:hypothetical protein FSP39_011968 [Pinctada imbricata]